MRPRLVRLLAWLGITVPELNEPELLAWLDSIDAPGTGAERAVE